MGCEWWPHRRKSCGQRIPLREEERRDTGGRTEGGPNHHRQGTKRARRVAGRKGEGVRRGRAESAVHLTRGRLWWR